MLKIKELFKELLGICILTPLLYNFCNAENYIENGIWRMSISNNETDYWSGKLTIADNRYPVNDYIIENIGNGNWKIYSNSGTYNNIFYVQSTNVRPPYAWQGIFFRDKDNTINYSFQTNRTGVYTENKIVRPIKMYHSTPDNFTNGVKNENNYTYDIDNFYNLNGNIEDIIIGVGSDRDQNQFTSITEGLFLCFNVDNTDIYCVSCDNSGPGNNNRINCKGGFETGEIINGIESWTLSDYESYIGESPFSGGGTGGNIDTITQYSCPTIQQLINTYGSDYTENLCYSSSLIYSGGTIQQITPKTIFELYQTYTGFTADISTYNTYCRSPNTTQACQTAFNGKDIEYTLLAKIPDNIKKANLYQYCNLQLNYPDKNATTCTLQASGLIATGLNETITINDIITAIGDENYTVITPGTPPQATGTGNGSGSVYDELLGDNEDDTERWNVIQNAKNIVQTMKELYTKFTGIFRGRQGTEGFIPEYITGILLLIILFKLFKK